MSSCQLGHFRSAARFRGLPRSAWRAAPKAAARRGRAAQRRLWGRRAAVAACRAAPARHDARAAVIAELADRDGVPPEGARDAVAACE